MLLVKIHCAQLLSPPNNVAIVLGNSITDIEKIMPKTAEPIILSGICVDCDLTIALFPEANLPAYCTGILLSDNEKNNTAANSNKINAVNNTIETILTLPASLRTIIDPIIVGILEIILTKISIDV